MRVLLLQHRGPMMSFGAPAIDDVRPAGRWPTRSMLTGQLGCALGWRREQAAELFTLQRRISYAVRCDRQPIPGVDFQTANVSTGDMAEPTLTPHGWLNERDGQWRNTKNVVNRYCEYLADGHFVIAVALEEPSKYPALEDVKHALDYPKAPLFLGRHAYPPTTRIAIGLVDAANLLGALSTVPSKMPKDQSEAWGLWPETEGRGLQGRVVQVIEDRDWVNDVHTGRRRMIEGKLPLRAARAAP